MTAAKKRQPWLKWFPSDWRAEPRLKMVSRAARSLWVDMLGLMHEAEPYGCLIVAGKPLEKAAEIACVLGDKEREIRKLLSELEEAKVFSRVGDKDLPDDIRAIIPSGLPTMTILSRKMLRDMAKTEVKRAAGKQGGNPALVANDVGEVKQVDKHPLKQVDKPRGQRLDSTLLRNDAPASDPKEVLNGTERPSKPVASDKDWLWREGLSWLSKATGKPEKSLRSQMGKWLRDTKEDAGQLRAIFEAAQAEAVFEPIAWITAAVKARALAAAPFEQTDEHGWRKRFEAYRKTNAWPTKWGGAFPGGDPRHPKHLVEEFRAKEEAA